MKKSARSKLILALEEIGRRFPEWRFGQLVENVAGWADVNTWDVDDEQMLAAALNYLESNSASLPSQKPRKIRSKQ